VDRTIIMDSSIFLTCIANTANIPEPIAALYHYGFDSAQDQADPEGGTGSAGSATVYGANGTAGPTLTTYVPTGSWDGGNYLHTNFIANQLGERDAGLFVDLIANGTTALLADQRNWSVGMVFSMGSEFYDAWTTQQKVFLVQSSSDGGLSSGGRPMMQMHPSTTQGTQLNLYLYGDAGGFPGMGEAGIDGNLDVIPVPDAQNTVIDLNDYIGQWIYLEMTHVYNGSVSLSVYTRDGLVAAQNFLVVDSANGVADVLYAFNNVSYFNVTTPADVTNMWMRTADLYVNDTFMGPPAGFVI